VSDDFADWIDEFASRYPIVADDVLEAIDDYLSTDPRDGPHSLPDSTARAERAERLTNLRARLEAARKG
jgi:hypothetical protein